MTFSTNKFCHSILLLPNFSTAKRPSNLAQKLKFCQSGKISSSHWFASTSVLFHFPTVSNNFTEKNLHTSSGFEHGSSEQKAITPTISPP